MAEEGLDIYEAIGRGNKQRVNELLDCGEDINQKSNFLSPLGNTPLHEAVVQGHTEVVRELIKAGSDVTSVNNGKETPLHIACLKGFTEITRVLIEAGSDLCATKGKLGVEPIHLAAFGGHIEVLTLLLNAGININTAKLDNGRTPLHIAAIHNCVDFVEALIANGCDLDPISSENEEAKTPLLKAVELGHVEIAKKLVAAGADTNRGDRWSVTPLLTVMLQGKAAIAKMLIQAGCDVNLASRNGVTPFTASLRNAADLTMFLVEANCKLTFTDKEHLARAVEIAPNAQQRMLLMQIQHVISNPRPLLHLCRSLIRHSLGKGCCSKTDTLCLPHELKNYLKYQDL
ncbi:ankyrin repeat and KH domain-containing protein 1-like isoform X2 [Liolophura sinensis]|uniref:ankyrin repeat and KH domain-containing protein 1-like isoform X2 n=1 Tax=Liolophura sinensis TaxID=3198878 RepID=UPI0031599251